MYGAFGEYENWMQEAMPGVIANYSKWNLKGIKTLQGGASGGVSGAGLFQEHVLEQGADLDFRRVGTIWSVWGVALGLIGLWRVDPLGVSRGFRRSRKQMYFESLYR